MNKLILLTEEELEDIIQKSMRVILSEQKQQEPKEASLPQFLDVTEAAKYVKLAKQTMYALSASNQIPHIKRHKRLVFLKTDLEQWLLEGRKFTDRQIREKLMREGKI